MTGSAKFTYCIHFLQPQVVVNPYYFHFREDIMQRCFSYSKSEWKADTAVIQIEKGILRHLFGAITRSILCAHFHIAISSNIFQTKVKWHVTELQKSAKLTVNNSLNFSLPFDFRRLPKLSKLLLVRVLFSFYKLTGLGHNVLSVCAGTKLHGSSKWSTH